MTPRERYEAVLAGEPVDQVPRLPILMQFAAEYIGSNYGAFASDHRVLAEANIRCAEDFGMEQLSAISDPYRETAGFGGEVVFHENAVPECVRPPLADDRDLGRLAVPDPFEAPRMRDRIDGVRLMRERTGDNYSVLGWIEGPAAEAADLRGVSEFLMDMMEEPEWCGELMDRCADAGIAFAFAQIAAGADTIGVGDAICSQISPDLYEELVLPRQQRLLAAIGEAGGRGICGTGSGNCRSTWSMSITWWTWRRFARRWVRSRCWSATWIRVRSCASASRSGSGTYWLLRGRRPDRAGWRRRAARFPRGHRRKTCEPCASRLGEGRDPQRGFHWVDGFCGEGWIGALGSIRTHWDAARRQPDRSEPEAKP